MVLCGTIKHHGQSDNQSFTELWSVMALYKTGGYASSLSAKSLVSRKIYRTFFFCVFRCSADGIFLFYVIIFQGAADENACI